MLYNCVLKGFCMSNVVMFPRFKRPPFGYKAVDSVDDGSSAKPFFLKLFSGLIFAVRMLLFFLLYWLRPLIVGGCSFASVLLLLAWLFAWYAFPDKTNMVWGFAALSFICFVVTWLYDFVLMALSPQDVVRTL